MIPIFLNSQIIGEVKDGIFYKTVSGKKNFLRKPPAIANNTSILEYVKELGAEEVIIRDKDTQKVYQASVELILRKGFKISRGFGEQIALPINQWTVLNTKNQPPLWT
jgi:hypothetical protein